MQHILINNTHFLFSNSELKKARRRYHKEIRKSIKKQKRLIGRKK